METIKIFNPESNSWMGTQYWIGNYKVPFVRSIDFHVGVEEVPTVNFEMTALPDILMDSDIKFSFAPNTILDAISILRHELLLYGEIYDGFKASLKSALEVYNCCGLPFEPEEEIAEKMLDFIIGEEK